MRISIVTPSYNQAQFIERTVQSVLGQRGDFELEYLVMDGGSDDGTAAILDGYAERLQFVAEKDDGPTDAIAKGLRAATGDVIGWLNSDDLYCEGALQRVKTAFDVAPAARWLCGKCRIIDTDDRECREWITRYKNWWLRHYSLRKLLIVNFISQPAVFFRRELIEEIGVPDKECKIAFDYAYWMRIATRYDPIIVDEYLASFRAYPQSLGSANTLQQFREECRMAVEYNPGMAFIKPLHTLNCWAVVAAYKLMRLFSGHISMGR